MKFCVYKLVSGEVCPLLITDSLKIAHKDAAGRGLRGTYIIGVMSDEAADYFARCCKESPMRRGYIITDEGVIRVVHREKPAMYLCIRQLSDKRVIRETYFDDSVTEISIIPDEELERYGFSQVSDQKKQDWLKENMVVYHPPTKRIVKYELKGQPVLDLTHIPRGPVQEPDGTWSIKMDICIYNGEEVEEILNLTGEPVE